MATSVGDTTASFSSHGPTIGKSIWTKTLAWMQVGYKPGVSVGSRHLTIHEAGIGHDLQRLLPFVIACRVSLHQPVALAWMRSCPRAQP